MVSAFFYGGSKNSLADWARQMKSLDSPGSNRASTSSGCQTIPIMAIRYLSPHTPCRQTDYSRTHAVAERRRRPWAATGELSAASAGPTRCMWIFSGICAAQQDQQSHHPTRASGDPRTAGIRASSIRATVHQRAAHPGVEGDGRSHADERQNRGYCGKGADRHTSRRVSGPASRPTSTKNGLDDQSHFRRICGRGKRIRTSGPCVPNAVLYQAELFPDNQKTLHRTGSVISPNCKVRQF